MINQDECEIAVCLGSTYMYIEPIKHIPGSLAVDP
jgi:hypothetical protein